MTNHKSLRTKKKQDDKKEALLVALEKTLGVVTPACKAIGVTRQTFYDFYNEDPEFAKRADACSEIALDFAESQLHKQINEGIPTSTIFYLKTQGKKRGYIERTEQDLYSGGKPLQVNVVNYDHNNSAQL